MEFFIQPWAHQREAFERAKDVSDFGFLFQPGTGKTGTVINVLRHKYNTHKRVLRTLIVGPPVVVRQWKDEWAKHSKIDLNKVVLLQGKGDSRVKLFDKHVERNEGFIAVTNYEGLLMGDLFNAIMKWNPEAVVWDESQRLKNHSAKRSKLAAKISAQATFRYILTGTPVLQSPLDLFSQFLVLDNGATFGTNFFAARARFFVDKNSGMPKANYFPAWVIKPGALKEINRMISTKSMSVRKDECLDLPPLVREVVKVELTTQQRRLFDEMKRDMIAIVNDTAVVATLAITRSLRLMQITSGFAKTATGDEVLFEESPKAKALKDLLEDITITGKCNVWCNFKAEYAQVRAVCESLGIQHVELTGDTTPKQRDENIERFRNDPDVKVMLGHPAAAGLGVNLVEAGYSIYFSRSYNLEHSLQSEARNYRGGSKEAGHEKITVIDIVAENTLDELILASLQAKEEISLDVLKRWLNEKT